MPILRNPSNHKFDSKAGKQMIRIVLTDDHALMRKSLARIVEIAEDIEVTAEAGNGIEALEYVRKGGFDVLLLDLSMPGLSGAELIHHIRHEAPALPILLLTMYDEDEAIQHALQAGANGVLEKEQASEELLAVIREIAAGRPYPTGA